MCLIICHCYPPTLVRCSVASGNGNVYKKHTQRRFRRPAVTAVHVGVTPLALCVCFLFSFFSPLSSARGQPHACLSEFFYFFYFFPLHPIFAFPVAVNNGALRQFLFIKRKTFHALTGGCAAAHSVMSEQHSSP